MNVQKDGSKQAIEYRGYFGNHRQGRIWPVKPNHSKSTKGGTPLLVQQLRTHLPIQGTWVGSLVKELKSKISHNSWQLRFNTAKKYTCVCVCVCVCVFKVPRTHDGLAYFVFGEGLPDTGGNSAYANRGRRHLSNFSWEWHSFEWSWRKEMCKRKGETLSREEKVRERWAWLELFSCYLENWLLTTRKS